MTQCAPVASATTTCGSYYQNNRDGEGSHRRPLTRAPVRGLSSSSSSRLVRRRWVPTTRTIRGTLPVAAANVDEGEDAESATLLNRRHSIASLGLFMAGSVAGGDVAAQADELPEVTDKVYIDVGLCDSIVRADRALGSKGGVCTEPESLGRIVIGLYGTLVPRTVENFVKLVSSPPGEGSYVGTVFHRVTPGRYILAGQSGSYRLGQVQAPRGLVSNPELLSGKSFELRHLRPGTVSLAIGAATGEVDGGGGGAGSGASMSGSQQNTEFLITTGPAPVPSLDGNNIVFGRVLEGMDVVTAIASVPTFKPSSNSRAWNQVAEWLKDERAEKARAVWSKPTKAIVITGGGVL